MTDTSIIIPTYNRLWSLPRAVNSCRGSACKTEIIVIDDGSTDGTWDWLQQQDDIIVLRQNNQGKCRAVNTGFALASGKYIRFLDSDDMVNVTANDEQYAIAGATGADIVTSGYKAIDENDHITNENAWTNCDDFIAQQLGECDGSHYSAFLFKKAFLTGIFHRPEFAYRDDRFFILEAALKNPVIANHNGFALLHRAHDKGRLQINQGLKQAQQNQQHFLIYQKILAMLEKQGRLTDRYKKASSNVLWHLAHWMAVTDRAEAKKVYDWVYELDPQFEPVENKHLDRLYKILGFGLAEKILSLKRNIRI
jgi:glycosyltransferase involved in cell wall biosynthesis